MTSRLRYGWLLVVFSGLATLLWAAGEQPQKEEAKQDLIEIKQGGYVEKIDPNVDYKDRLPRIPPKEPAESMKTFHIIDGFRVELVAAEPMVCDPVDLTFDENGRLYVAEMIPYAEGNTAEFGSPEGRVSRLEDTDGDGLFDKSTIYVDKLVWPTGVTCFDGGIFVASAPDVWYCKDADGDGKADLRELVITGFDLGNPCALPNSLRWGLDNRIHAMTGTSGGEIRAVKWERGGEGRQAQPLRSQRRDFGFHPRTGELGLESGGSQFGMTYDVWGNKFESSNSVPIEMVMYEDRYVARNPYLAAPSPRVAIAADPTSIKGRKGAVYRTSPVEPWRVLRTELRVRGTFSGPIEGGGTPAGYFTGACGVTIYTGDTWPKEFLGNSFTAEGSGNLVHRKRLEPDGIGFKAYRTEQEHEFLTSDEIWFRPIQFTNAPDGTFYMADMYRELYEHPNAVPPSAKKHLDLTAGKNRGRIYRIVPDRFKQPKPVRLGETSTAGLVGLLEHPNGWHRITASRLLYERQDRHGAFDLLVKLQAESASPPARMHAMYALDGMGLLEADVVLARLGDEHPRVREHAVRLSEKVLQEAPGVREKLYTMVADEDVRVRYQLAFTLGETHSRRATDALAAVAARDVDRQWTRLAVLTSCFGRAGELFSRLAEDRRWRSTKEGRAFLEDVAEQAGLQELSDQVAEVLKALEGFGEDEKDLTRAAVRGLGKGLEKSGSPLREQLGSGSKGGQALVEMVQQAKALAADDKQPVERRTEAVRSLALASFEEVENVLGDLLDGRQPQEVQKAALQALSRFQEDDVPEMIVDGWLGFSPQVRGEAAEAMFARPERLSILLEAIADQVISPSQLDPARIQFLLAYSDEQIRNEATHLLSSAQLAPRQEVVDAYRDVLQMKGDAARGKEVFKRECSKCHLLEGVGVELGLPLDAIGNRGPETILLALLDPNRDVNPSYLNYVVVTDNGLSITGMITAETASSITLKRAEGETDTVLRANIDQLVSTGLSIMPEGQEKLVTKQEIADVIAYLMSIE